MLTNLEEVFINCSLSPNVSTEVPRGQEPEDYYDKRMVGNISTAEKENVLFIRGGEFVPCMLIEFVHKQ